MGQIRCPDKFLKKTAGQGESRQISQNLSRQKPPISDQTFLDIIRGPLIDLGAGLSGVLNLKLNFIIDDFVCLLHT